MFFTRVVISVILALVLVNLSFLLLHNSPKDDHKSIQRSQLQASEIPEAQAVVQEEPEGFLVEAILPESEPEEPEEPESTLGNSPAASRAMASVYDEDDKAAPAPSEDEGILVDDEDFSAEEKSSLEIVKQMKSVVDSMNPEDLSVEDLGQFEEDEREVAKKLRIQERKRQEKEREERERLQMERERLERERERLEREREEHERLFAPTPLVLQEGIDQRQLRINSLSVKKRECEPLEGTPSESCPTMHTCRDAFQHISFCHLPQFTDASDATLATTTITENGKVRKLSRGYKASEGHLFRASQVFVDFKGAVFDHETIYSHGGCKGQYKVTLNKGEVVQNYPEVINLGHIWSQQQFHLLTDVLATAFQMRDFITSNPEIPILVKSGTDTARLSKLLRLDHLPLKFVPLKDGAAVFAQKAYFALSPQCGLASGAVWTEMRKFFSDGRASLPAPTPRKILVSERHTLPDGRKVFDILEAKFGADRVVLLRDGINHAEVFSTAPAIFVASQGSAAWNQIYLPEGSSVVEVVPKPLTVSFFGHLAAIFGFDYQPVAFSGGKASLSDDLVLAVKNAAGADL